MADIIGGEAKVSSQHNKADDMTGAEILMKEAEIQRSGRSFGVSISKGYALKRELSLLHSRVGQLPAPRKNAVANRSNVFHTELNRGVGYMTDFPVGGTKDMRHYNMTTSLGKTSLEMSNRRKRGNKKVRRRRKKKI